MDGLESNPIFIASRRKMLQQPLHLKTILPVFLPLHSQSKPLALLTVQPVLPALLT